MSKKQKPLKKVSIFTRKKETVPRNAYVSDPFTFWQTNLNFCTIINDSNHEQLALILDEYTQPTEIKLAWKRIEEFILELDSLQGSKFDSEKDKNILGLVVMWEEFAKMPWEKLRFVLNYLAMASAYSAYKASKRKDKSTGVVIDSYLYEMRRSVGKSDFFRGEGRSLAITFTSFRKDAESFEDWMKNAFEFLDTGRWETDIIDSPFEPKDTAKIRSRVDYLLDKIKDGKKFGGPRNSTLNVYEKTVYALYQEDCFSKINEMLDKEGHQGWEKNKAFVCGKVNKIIDKWNNSRDPEIVLSRDAIKKVRKN